jgi:hypothetical protein
MVVDAIAIARIVAGARSPKRSTTRPSGSLTASAKISPN